jgi:very-short-patch-repair endonuclease
MESTLGLIIFVSIFIAIPIYYGISLIVNPSMEGVPVIDNERLKCESPIESRLYNALTIRGYFVRTQVPCGKYRIDIALPQYGLAIECDGKAYHSTPEQKAHDRKKNIYLKKNGWRVLRFSGSQINGNMSKVLSEIENKINGKGSSIIT